MADTTKYRSKFERTIARNSKKDFKYEPFTIDWNAPTSKYTPDFVLPNNVIIEAKGFLSPADRRKMKAVKAQHPDLDIRFIFQNAKNTLSKKSKTTYGDWATKNGFIWSSGAIIPEEWY